ncbi:MAG: hypothetical protein WCI11_12420 [Candidatus Methylumidiphilus sp.]
MPESSHKDVKLGVATKAFSNTYATDRLPSMALDSGILSRNDGNGAIMRIAARTANPPASRAGLEPASWAGLEPAPTRGLVRWR